MLATKVQEEMDFIMLLWKWGLKGSIVPLKPKTAEARLEGLGGLPEGMSNDFLYLNL